MMIPLENDIRVPAGLVRIERKVKILHEATNLLQRSLWECKLKRFVVKTRELFAWMCIELLVSYQYDISEGENILGVRHRVTVKRPCDTCIVLVEDIIDGEMAYVTTLEETKLVIRIHLGQLTKNISSVANVHIIAEEVNRAVNSYSNGIFCRIIPFSTGFYVIAQSEGREQLFFISI